MTVVDQLDYRISINVMTVVIISYMYSLDFWSDIANTQEEKKDKKGYDVFNDLKLQISAKKSRVQYKICN